MSAALQVQWPATPSPQRGLALPGEHEPNVSEFSTASNRCHHRGLSILKTNGSGEGCHSEHESSRHPTCSANLGARRHLLAVPENRTKTSPHAIHQTSADLIPYENHNGHTSCHPCKISPSYTNLNGKNFAKLSVKATIPQIPKHYQPVNPTNSEPYLSDIA